VHRLVILREELDADLHLIAFHRCVPIRVIVDLEADGRVLLEQLRFAAVEDVAVIAT